MTAAGSVAPRGDGDVQTADGTDDNDDDVRPLWREELRRRREIVCAVNSADSAIAAKLRACECVRTCVRVRSSQPGDTRGPARRPLLARDQPPWYT